MKLRRLALMCVLLLLAMAMTVVPVQAGKKATDFTFTLDQEQVTSWEQRQTGAIWHYTIGLSYVIVGGGNKLDGGILNITFKTTDRSSCSIDVCPHWTSGPWHAKWQITNPSKPGTGWEGTGVSRPGTQFFTFTGKGFGEYQKMHIVWTYVEGSLTGNGEISTN
jgi:hypothetical protein